MFDNLKPHFVTGNTWHDKLTDLNRLRQDAGEAMQYAPHMQQNILRRFDEERDRIAPAIVRGVVIEFQGEISKVQERQARLAEQKQREAKRWDFAKLDGERRALQGMIDTINQRDGFALGGGPDKVDRLRTLWAECMTSGDLHRARAAAEIFAGLSDMNLTGNDKRGLPMNRAVVGLTIEAKAKAGEIRTTPDLEAEAVKLDESIGALINKRAELRDVAIALGESDPAGALSGGSELARNYRQVGVDHGEIVIRPVDDPAIIGVDWTKYYQSLEGAK
jgi:hypothetical protein